MEGPATKIHVFVKKDIVELTVDNRSVKMVVRMEDVALDPIDVPVSMVLQDLSAKEITELGLASHKSATRCARASSVVLCVQRHCVVPPLAVPGVTHVKCALLNPTHAAEDSFQIFELEPAKMLMNVKPYLVCARAVTALTQLVLMSVNAQLDTNRARPPRSVKILMSAVQYLMCVMEGNAPILLGAMSASVLEDLPRALMDLAALIRGKAAVSLL